MKARYVLFTFVAYNNTGGFDDMAGSSDNLRALIHTAETHVAQLKCEYWNIIDLTTFKVAAEGPST
jgi:hypothetical protein